MGELPRNCLGGERGNVIPHSLHGGPRQAEGGEQLGGLAFYRRRSAIQAEPKVLDARAAQPLSL